MIAAWALLVAAIVVEVAATSAIPRSEGFRNPAWSAAVLAGYALAIWLLALVVQHIPVSITYAVWSGLGTAGIAVVGVLFLGERLVAMQIVALLLIIAGVLLLNLTTAH